MVSHVTDERRECIHASSDSSWRSWLWYWAWVRSRLGPDSAKLKEFRLGLLGGENTQDRLARYGEFQKLLAERLGMPIKLFPAADYAGVMQAIAAGQLDGAQFSGSSFAGAWLDCKCIEPVVVPREKDGSVYYIAVMLVRADSGIKSLQDMKGHSLAWADPNSTSGYLIPSATLKGMGIKLDDGAYFSKTGFAGGHEQGIISVVNKQYDAAVTWTSGLGEEFAGLLKGSAAHDGRQAYAENVGHQHHLAFGKDSEWTVGVAFGFATGPEGDVPGFSVGSADRAPESL